MQNNPSTIIYFVLFVLFLIFVTERNLISFKSVKRKREFLLKGSTVYVKTRKPRELYNSLPFEIIKEGVILSITENGYIVRIDNVDYLIDFEDVYLKD